MEEIYDDKILTLADWLETDDLNAETIILDIEDQGGNEYYYDGETYLVLSEKEVEDQLDSYADDLISEIQREINRDSLWYSHYLLIDEESIRDNVEVTQIGEIYDEFNNYYIFTM